MTAPNIGDTVAARATCTQAVAITSEGIVAGRLRPQRSKSVPHMSWPDEYTIEPKPTR
jgi:hypothetical protein